jgi:transcription-repair coupling factor (superfamily II helicase)
MKSLSSSIKDLLHSWPQFNNAVSSLVSENAKYPVDVLGIHGCLFGYFTNELVNKISFANLQAVQYNNATAYTEKQYKTFSKDLVIVVLGETEANKLYTDFTTVMPEAEVYILSYFSSIPYRPAAPGSAIFGQRAGVLSKLASKNDYDLLNKKPPRIFIVTMRAFLNSLPPPESINKGSFTIKVKDSIDTVRIAGRLSELGYTRVSKVGVRGEFSLRGEVLDIFLPLDENPTRFIFDFDEIESIKTFETENQTTLGSKESVFIYPMKEVLWNDELVDVLEKKLDDYQNSAISNDNDSAGLGGAENNPNVHLPFTDFGLEFKNNLINNLRTKGTSEGEELYYGLVFDRQYSVLDYITDNTFVLLYDFDRLENTPMLLDREYKSSYRKARGVLAALPPQLIKFELNSLLEKHLNCINIKTIKGSPLEEIEENAKFEGNSQDEIHYTEEKPHPGQITYAEMLGYESPQDNKIYEKPAPAVSRITIDAEPGRSFFGNIIFMKEELEKLQNDNWNVFIFTNSENQQLRIHEIFKEFTDTEKTNPVKLIPKAVSEGFIIPDKKLLVIQENEIFGRRKYIPKSLSKAKSKPIDTFVDLNPGDYVVHVNWGIGLFHGIERVKAMGNERDYIKLEYADEEYAFVPIEQVNLVQRYIGNEGNTPRLDRIGSKAWENRKNKVQQSVEELANKLIDLYSRRKTSVGFAFPKETEWQTTFEAAFPYEDTPDQITVTEEVKKDMEKPVPMDRLVCGDVGYGKTEIAMRAAFKAVMGGKQVAFLAPTTILAEQHYETCIERFKNFPVKIARLSRFVPPAEQKEILKKLVLGEIDILVGTHRIIQKDVLFKQLGLMIIDEEQRFGVKDKEKLKEIKNNIDCLTMSATPIPRTLHMSLLKIRDMSLLTTPPQNRQAIETYVDEYSDQKVIEAIRNEIERGGQIFYLHNRIEDLYEVKRKIEQLVPEVLVDMAHGRMSSGELDDIFQRFKMGGFHVLISTTIIENGIDIPNVNTIIIDRADMYGVSQLYQLRGRVGRSDRKAYAYLLYPGNKSLNEDAMKRLQVISDFTELGSGFKIAMKDMEIRGAGNLLGKDQHGDVYAVGFDLYVRLLNEAVNKLLHQKDYKPQTEVLMELEYTGYIPDSYVTNQQIKMEIYKKIAAVSSVVEFESVLSELNDRFGPIPEEVSSLLALAEIRIICKKLSISSIKERLGEVKITFDSVSNIQIDRILKLIKDNPGTIRINPAGEQAIYIKLGKIGLKEKSEFIREKLSQLL